MTYEATVDRVLAHLRETRGEWAVLANEAIRRDVEGDSTCPVVSASGTYGDWDALSVAHDAGFDEDAAGDLIIEADMYVWGSDLRERMLTACGLEGEAA